MNGFASLGLGFTQLGWTRPWPGMARISGWEAGAIPAGTRGRNLSRAAHERSCRRVTKRGRRDRMTAGWQTLIRRLVLGGAYLWITPSVTQRPLSTIRLAWLGAASQGVDAFHADKNNLLKIGRAHV